MTYVHETELRAFADGKAIQFLETPGVWRDFDPARHPELCSALLRGDHRFKFRTKPRTVKIGNREVEAPVLEPVTGQELWYWDQGQWGPTKTTGDHALKSCDFMKAGLFFASPEACRAAREAVTALMRGEA